MNEQLRYILERDILISVSISISTILISFKYEYIIDWSWIVILAPIFIGFGLVSLVAIFVNNNR